MDSDFIKGMNKCLDAYNGVIGNIYVYSHHTEMTDKLDELAETLAQGGGPTPPTPDYDYYISNVDLDGHGCLQTDIEIFSTANRVKAWQIDFKMTTSKSGEAPFCGTSINASSSNLELYNNSSSSYIYVKGYIDEVRLSRNLNGEAVTILYDGNGTFTFKIDGETIDTFERSSFPSGTYSPGYLTIGRYIGGNTYYFDGYCDYFGFKWLT